MVIGNEHIFDNIYQARDYILDLERKALFNDPMRLSPPMVMRAPDFSRPFDKNINKPIPVDCLDYPFCSIFNDADDNKFIMCQLASGRFSLKPNLKGHKFLFRGESAFHPSCKPNLFRNPKKTYYLDSMIHGDEMFRLILSHPLVQLLDQGVILNGRLIRFEMNLYGLIQHYYNKSALMDLTSDINVASFFATQKYDYRTDTYSPIIDENQEPGVLYYYNVDLNRDFQRRFNGELLSTIGLQVFPRSGRQRGFIYECTKNTNFNELLQLQAFRFKHNAAIAQEISDMMNNGEKLFPHDILQSHWRNTARDENTVSEDAIKFNLTRNPNETMSSICSKLKNDYNIDVDNYKPVLSEAELHEYYEDVKNEGLWEKFCSQIYIPGDTTGKMMADLLDVPNKSEYKWAFEEGIDHIIDYEKGFLMKKFKHILKD